MEPVESLYSFSFLVSVHLYLTELSKSDKNRVFALLCIYCYYWRWICSGFSAINQLRQIPAASTTAAVVSVKLQEFWVQLEIIWNLQIVQSYKQFQSLVSYTEHLIRILNSRYGFDWSYTWSGFLIPDMVGPIPISSYHDLLFLLKILWSRKINSRSSIGNLKSR